MGMYGPRMWRTRTMRVSRPCILRRVRMCLYQVAILTAAFLRIWRMGRARRSSFKAWGQRARRGGGAGFRPQGLAGGGLGFRPQGLGVCVGAKVQTAKPGVVGNGYVLYHNMHVAQGLRSSVRAWGWELGFRPQGLGARVLTTRCMWAVPCGHPSGPGGGE